MYKYMWPDFLTPARKMVLMHDHLDKNGSSLVYMQLAVPDVFDLSMNLAQMGGFGRDLRKPACSG